MEGEKAKHKWPLALYLTLILYIVFFVLAIAYFFDTSPAYEFAFGPLLLLIIGIGIYCSSHSDGRVSKRELYGLFIVFFILLAILFVSSTITEPFTPLMVSVIGFSIAGLFVNLKNGNKGGAGSSILAIIIAILVITGIFTWFYNQNNAAPIRLLEPCTVPFACQNSVLFANGKLIVPLSLENTSSKLRVISLSCGYIGEPIGTNLEVVNFTLSESQSQNVTVTCVQSGQNSYLSLLGSYVLNQWECGPPLAGCGMVGATIEYFDGHLNIVYQGSNGTVLNSTGSVFTGFP